MSEQPRSLLFVSHANPEDNEFARWITLQLTKHGYAVWCDLTRMLGGQDQWDAPEQAIAHGAAKVLYVLSRASNEKKGVRKELQVAENVAQRESLDDFIIPLHIDDLPYREVNIRAVNHVAVPFENGWAQGLDQLLRALESGGVPKDAAATAGAVTGWWRTQFSADAGVVHQPERCPSNWFRITGLPEWIHVHRLGLTRVPGKLEVDEADLPYPGKQRGQNLVSFAAADDFAGRLGPFTRIERTETFRTAHLLEDEVNPIFTDRSTARRLLSEMLRKSWEHMLHERRLPTYTFSDGGTCFYFTKGLAEGDRLPLTGVNGKPTYRNCVGFRNIRRPDGTARPRYWHLAFQARPYFHPELVYGLRTHVLFSDDASVLWDNRDKMHRARRRQCANWWNPKWRDMLVGGMAWLARGERHLTLTVGTDATVTVEASPLLFDSPVSYARNTAEVDVPADGAEEAEPDEEELDEEDEDDA